MTGSQSQKGLLPAGLSDILYPKAQVQAKKIENLLDVFANYGYLRVKPPLVEYEETLFQRYELTEDISLCYFNENKYEKPIYDHVTSSTGRSKISKGLNLTIQMMWPYLEEVK